jgi:hypothetical protein
VTSLARLMNLHPGARAGYAEDLADVVGLISELRQRQQFDVGERQWAVAFLHASSL